MKDHPILFSGAMVRALLDGTKTQTRRALKVRCQEIGERDDGSRWPWSENPDTAGDHWHACPYGQPGDRLWVRETWLEDPEDDGTWAYTQYVGCKGSPLSDIPRKFQKPEHCIYREGWNGSDLRWRPSIHMPRWASRILLEVVSVHVEWLQDISEKDARAEGVTIEDRHMSGYCVGQFLPPSIRAYRDLWESINGVGSWDANPWVWVVEFKRVTT
jgi:hypothetical protein